MCIERVFRGWKDRVKFGLPYVAIEAIDLVESGIAVYREAVWSETDEFALQGVSELTSLQQRRGITIFLVSSPELEMAITLPRVIYLMPVCDFRKKWTWVFGKRMELQTIDYDRSDLSQLLGDRE